MRERIIAALDRMQSQIDELRALVAQDAGLAAGEESSGAIPEAPVAIFRLRTRYTQRQADAAKRAIDAAFARGEVSYDKKRGLKMRITKTTDRPSASN